MNDSKQSNMCSLSLRQTYIKISLFRIVSSYVCVSFEFTACVYFFCLGKKGNEKFTVILLNQMDVVAMKKKSSVFG